MNFILNKGKKMKKLIRYLPLFIFIIFGFNSCSSKSYHSEMDEKAKDALTKENLDKYRESYSRKLLEEKGVKQKYISVLQEKSLSDVLRELEYINGKYYFLKTNDILIPKSRFKIHSFKELNQYLRATIEKELSTKRSGSMLLVSLLSKNEAKKRVINRRSFKVKGELSIGELMKLITLKSSYEFSLGNNFKNKEAFKDSIISIQASTILDAINAIGHFKNVFVDIDYEKDVISIKKYKDVVIEINIPLLELETKNETTSSETSGDSTITNNSSIKLYEELDKMLKNVVAADKISTYHIDKSSGLIFLKATKSIEKTLRTIVKVYEQNFAKETTIEFERVELILNKSRTFGIGSISKKPNTDTIGTSTSIESGGTLSYAEQSASKLIEVLGTSNNTVGMILNYSKNLFVLKNNIPTVQTISQNTDYIEKIETTVVDNAVTSEATVNTIKDGTSIVAMAKISRDKIFLNITPNIKKLIKISTATIGDSIIQLPEYKYQSYNIAREIRLGESVVVGSIIVHDDSKDYEGIVPIESFAIGGIDSKSYIRREIVYLITVTNIKGF